MNVEKVIRVTITKEEYKALKKAETILEEVCNAFGEDCEECPFYKLCGEIKSGRSPHTTLYHCASVLPVED